MNLKKVDKVSTVTSEDKSFPYTMAIEPSEWSWYYMTSFNDVNYKTSATNHLWMYFFGLYDQFSLNKINQTYAYGGISDTAYAGLIDAFSLNGAYTFQINQTQYRVEANGYNLAINIPLDAAYTGMTSGLTATTLYSSFIYKPGCLDQATNSLCSGSKVDMLKSEDNRDYTDKLGFGFAFVDGVNPDIANPSYPWFDSGIVALVTDDVYNIFTGATGSSLSWSVGFDEENKYGKFGARLISFRGGDNNPTIWDGPGYDRVVGFFNIKSGMGVIFDENLVNGLDISKFSGSFSTGATPTDSGSTFVVAGDIDYSTSLNVSVIIPEDSPNSTTNPSFFGQNEDCDLAFDRLCLYDEPGNVVAIAEFSEAIPLGKITPLSFTIPVDSGINEDGVFTRGRIDSL